MCKQIETFYINEYDNPIFKKVNLTLDFSTAVYTIPKITKFENIEHELIAIVAKRKSILSTLFPIVTKLKLSRDGTTIPNILYIPGIPVEKPGVLPCEQDNFCIQILSRDDTEYTLYGYDIREKTISAKIIEMVLIYKQTDQILSVLEETYKCVHPSDNVSEQVTKLVPLAANAHNGEVVRDGVLAINKAGNLFNLSLEKGKIYNTNTDYTTIIDADSLKITSAFIKATHRNKSEIFEVEINAHEHLTDINNKNIVIIKAAGTVSLTDDKLTIDGKASELFNFSKHPYMTVVDVDLTIVYHKLTSSFSTHGCYDQKLLCIGNHDKNKFETILGSVATIVDEIDITIEGFSVDVSLLKSTQTKQVSNVTSISNEVKISTEGMLKIMKELADVQIKPATQPKDDTYKMINNVYEDNGQQRGLLKTHLNGIIPFNAVKDMSLVFKKDMVNSIISLSNLQLEDTAETRCAISRIIDEISKYDKEIHDLDDFDKYIDPAFRDQETMNYLLDNKLDTYVGNFITGKLNYLINYLNNIIIEAGSNELFTTSRDGFSKILKLSYEPAGLTVHGTRLFVAHCNANIIKLKQFIINLYDEYVDAKSAKLSISAAKAALRICMQYENTSAYNKFLKLCELDIDHKFTIDKCLTVEGITTLVNRPMVDVEDTLDILISELES